MAVLITGGMGFIGLHTARRFLDAGSRVVLTRFRAWRVPDFLAAEVGGDRLAVEPVDLADGWALLDVVRRRGVRSIVHLAGPALGTEPAAEYSAALSGLVNVLETTRQQGLDRLSIASSVSVYDGAGTGPWREDQPLPVASGSHIGAVKKAVEALALDFAGRTDVDVRILRLAAIYGPLYHSMANLPSRLCHAAVAGRAPDLTGVRGGPPHLEDAADLCYVKDCAAGIQLIHTSARLEHRQYNIGAGRATSNAELVAAVRRVIPDARLEIQPGAGGDAAPEPYMDIARAGNDAGYRPQHDVEAAVAEYISWLRAHPE
jgi:UDP-glucose 4-epimerase